MELCIASIDQGTSSTRVLLVSSSGKILSSHQVEHVQHYPSPGYVEHDPLEIWQNVKLCLSESLHKSKVPVKVVGVGITNQRETTVVWNKRTGRPYHHAIVWNDARTSDICETLIKQHGSKDAFRQKTGLPIASYFSASKLLYLLALSPEIRKDAEKGDALFGTIDTWLIWRLTGGKVHATDVTNGSRTLLMNLETLNWDDEILKKLNIPRAMLPDIRASSSNFGSLEAYTETSFFEYAQDEAIHAAYDSLHGVPVSGVLGDQQAALFGQCCFQPGDAKCTYGTGAFLLLNSGNKIVHSTHGLLTTVAYQLHGTDKPVYALEGSVAYSGSVIQWLRDNLEMIKSASETEAISLSVEDNGGVYFVPAFAGLYAPYWREDAIGVIAGLTAFNNKAHIIRAALEASAFQTIEIIDAMKKDFGNNDSPVPKSSLKVDGGLTANNFIMQFQSDLLNIPLVKPKIAETTALGAAFIAGIGVGLWPDLEAVQSLWEQEIHWGPVMQAQQRATLKYHWQKALSRTLYWRNHVQFDSEGKMIEKSGFVDPYIQHIHGMPSIPTTPALPEPPKKVSTTTTTAVVASPPAPKESCSSSIVKYGFVLAIGALIGYAFAKQQK